MKTPLAIIVAVILGCNYSAMANPLPKIIAHRGGQDNWPPNTACAFKNNIQAGVDAIELDVQVTKDGMVVLYHPEDLKDQTTTTGKIADKTAAEVTALDSTRNYTGPKDYLTQCTPDEVKIPTLVGILKQFPTTTFVIDLKSLPAEPLVQAIAREVPKADLKRITFYSTNKEHLDAVAKLLPNATRFEERTKTFDRLLASAGANQCTIPNKSSYVGFELVRELNICEKFKLGDNCFKTPFQMWTPSSVACTEQMTQSAKIILFGIDTPDAYKKAWELGAYGVYSNNPKALLKYRK